MRNLLLGAIVLLAAAASSGVRAQDGDDVGNVQAGRELAVESCSECHVVVARRFTPPRKASPPDFVEIARARGTTARALFVFLHTPHPSMPNLILSDKESADVIAYILSLKHH